ncbi:nucleotide exchange factor GrpE [Leeuwenhoekiella palythoae]|uniref:Protein GrpE n=1 Tax=Leeuwenhoekiella palythoae TaxID=573501 RepID=A0A1M5Z1I8_9FLAO|nr:nucleotide exchange factor GrpE [Leeuwenhoekiella palythoae]MBH12288.1 nucleotide exchange factor GrpE [Leeuwenhoekiella sp.]MEC7782994.1 nucleotide exchange factor GrpE [Bacteroidota bacterium]MEC8682154.1 nucleotide exchange factor GrpE [Bacteroidota bacterium]MEE3149273.1 nucleotide exchange factor GrpE [Bacteroidota bacterium]MEE3243059.1 nucleotide exchange factor GrpE [Bacteroidota bacterium]|tara:strand:+ start:2619 stop:3194 length:576 start_codon:yes stop_codon:yes gene_type:complete
MSSENKEEILHENEENNAQDVQDATQEAQNEPAAAEDIATDEDELAKYKADLEKEKDKFLRLFAEFENYKRRTSKERVELFKTAGQEVMQAMLPVLDDFDRAMVEIEKAKDKNLQKGVELISNKLRETLKTKGLKQMEVQAGDAFDADVHEAITQIPAPQEDLKGKIVDVVEKGYELGERIIRYPKVVVGQ